MEKKIDENEENEVECLYENFRAIAEEDPNRKIAVLVKSENEIKAAYRAAVYGEISLLFGNIFTKEDAESAKESTRRAFCELLEEKHEFNGFVSKGILIDTPLALLTELSVQGFDFFCYDAEKISILLAGEKITAQKHRQAIKNIILNHMEPTLPCQTIDFQAPIERRIWVCKDG